MARHIITNGDFAAHALTAHFPDAEILIWRDVLIEGPVPAAIEGEAFGRLRADYIATTFGLDASRVLDDFTRRDRSLAAISSAAEVELWFETDLHDQLQLIQLLDLFAARPTPPLLSITLAPPPLRARVDDMAAGLAQVAEIQLREASALWQAFRAPTPGTLVAAARAAEHLPAAAVAILRLLEEFPGQQDGLGRIERNALAAIAEGADTPREAFGRYQETEPLPFLGDLGFFSRLDFLASRANPLVAGLPTGGIAEANRTNRSVEYQLAEVSLTDTGHAVLNGDADWVALGGIDRWIGGVHLKGDRVWRYDAAAGQLIAP